MGEQVAAGQRQSMKLVVGGQCLAAEKRGSERILPSQRTVVVLEQRHVVGEIQLGLVLHVVQRHVDQVGFVVDRLGQQGGCGIDQ